MTNRRIYNPCVSVQTAIAHVDQWVGCPTMRVLGEDASTWELMRDLLVDASIVGSAVHDARIAAVCIQHDVAELWTNDRDFRRFPQLRTRNPLIDPLPTRAGEARARYRVERRGRPAATR